ncbi:transcriptional regulator [Heliobacillus mobilis]|uniref:Sporulation protein n=1 Tax=Heliobacterium mobile TaxID=28064 RepID=Q0PIH1_HELMO|nr:SpoVG family protein [Heliobacterium mobile]ABH04846.1 sporulation protein [Heliobacterium mobile]MTV49784.1 transcriptional regulator [Heliobacterium mobile]
MVITDVKIKKINLHGPVRAIASVTLENSFVIHEIKVVAADKGTFVAMPSRRNHDGTYHDIAHPISHEARTVLTEAVMKAFYSSTYGEGLGKP